MSDIDQQTLRFFFEHAPLALIEWDNDWCVRSWNPAAERIFGWTAKEAIGRHFEFLVPESILEHIQEVAHNISVQRGGSKNSNQNLTKSGRIIDCDWYNTALTNADGQTVGAISCAQDVTHTLETRRRVVAYSQQLSDLNAQLLKLSQSRTFGGDDLESSIREITLVAARGLNVARSSCWILSDDGRRMLPATTYDLARKEFIENAPLELGRFPNFFRSLEEDRLIAAQYARRDMRTREFSDQYFEPHGITSKLSVATRLRGELKGMICFEHVGSPREWVSGEQVFASAIADHISLALEASERQKAEAEQKRLEDQLFQSQKMEALGTLAGGIAHDFNNILAAILGSTELALVRANSGQIPLQQLLNVNKSALRARDIVQQILSFSKKEPLELRPIHLQHAVEDSLNLLRSTLPASIEMDVSLEAPDGVVLGSYVQIHQLLLNLCTNAAHACAGAKGRLNILLREVTFSPSAMPQLLPHPNLAYGDYLLLIVQDNGSGIDPDTVKFIFDPFFTTKDPGTGSGLGLSIVHSIIASYKGAVTVATRPGEGTTFSLYFPREHVLVPEAEENQQIQFGAGEHILFIDDDESVLSAGAELLRYLGYEVSAYNCPHKGLDAFVRDPDSFAAVITDLSMPKITGVDVAEQVRSIRPKLPIMLTSGFGVNNGSKDGRFDAMLTKPFLLHGLSTVIRRTLKTA